MWLHRWIVIPSLLFLSATNHATPRLVSGAPRSAAAGRPITLSTREHSGRANVLEAYGRLALQFEANQGQTDGEVKFLARGSGYSLFLTATEAVLIVPKPPAADQRMLREPGRFLPRERQATKGVRPRQAGQSVLRMKLLGANPQPQVAGLDALPGKMSYFIGKDSRKWRTHIRAYARVKYKDVYPGVDLIFYGSRRRLEYDFVVTPGADPAVITLAFGGLGEQAMGWPPLRIDARGDLIVRTASGEFRLERPRVYQEIAGVRREISGRYVLTETDQVGFRVGAYDTTRPLVIDPVLAYSTYLGGSYWDNGSSIAVDASGNVYATGYTQSVDFPTADPFQPGSRSSWDVFVTKLDPAGSALIYSTYLGGTGGEAGSGIALDTAGNAYVTGFTDSDDFPTVNPLQPRLRKGGICFGGVCPDAFVAKLDSTGSALVYSTYLGGSGEDGSSAIAVDASGNAYVTGGTGSNDFPIANALQPTYGGGFYDAFVAKLNPAGSALVYSTYLGGTDVDQGSSIAVDGSGNAHVSGQTFSSGFPTANPLQPAYGGRGDAFVAKLNPAGSALVYSTYLGGTHIEHAGAIAVDASGNAYVTGGTVSNDFPVVNALQPRHGGYYDAFVAKLNPMGSALVYSTFLGGRDWDIANAITVDAEGSAYLVGETNSADFPTANPLQRALGGGMDAFLAKLDPAGSTLVFSTYLGGGYTDSGRGIGLDRWGNAYAIGFTQSVNFPTWNPLQPRHGGGWCGFEPCPDAFVAKLRHAEGAELALGVNQLAFRRGEMLILQTMVSPGSTPLIADAYVAVALPDGTLLFLQGDGSFAREIRPIVTRWTVAPFAGEIFRYTFTGGEPAGSYVWLAAFTHPGTLNIIGGIVQAPFTFSP